MGTKVTSNPGKAHKPTLGTYLALSGAFFGGLGLKGHDSPLVSANQNAAAVSQDGPRLTAEERILLADVHAAVLKGGAAPKVVLRAIRDRALVDADSNPTALASADILVGDYSFLMTSRAGNLSMANKLADGWLELGGKLTPKLESFRKANLAGTINFYPNSGAAGDAALNVVWGLTPGEAKSAGISSLKLSVEVFNLDRDGKQSIAVKSSEVELKPTADPPYNSFEVQGRLQLPAQSASTQILVKYALVPLVDGVADDARKFEDEQVLVSQPSSDPQEKFSWISTSTLAREIDATVRAARDELKNPLDPQKLLGKSLPELRLDNLGTEARANIIGGSSLDLRDGRVKVISLWATWCSACMSEQKELARIKQEFPAVEVYSLCLSARPEDVKALPGLAAQYPQNFGALAPGVARELQAVFIPVTFVVDGQGVAQAVVKGFDPSSTLIEEALVAEQKKADAHVISR